MVRRGWQVRQGRPAWQEAATESDPAVLAWSFVLDVRASFTQRAPWLAAPHPATLAADPATPAWVGHEPRPSLTSHRSQGPPRPPPLLIDPGQTSSSGTDPVGALGNEHVRIGSGHSGGTDPGQQYRLNNLRPVPVHVPPQAAGNGPMETADATELGHLWVAAADWVGRVAPVNDAAVNYGDAGAEHPYSDATARGWHLSGLVGATNGRPTEARSPARPGRA